MITGFARVDIAAQSAAADSDRWAAFLGRSPETSAAGADFALANVTLRIRETGEGEAPGLARLAFAVADVETARGLLGRRGAPTTPHGAEALLDRAASHGPALALAASQDRPPLFAGPGDIEALDHLVIRTADAERAIALYGARLGLDFRLDRSNPAWGARLLFFRCGDAVVEISAPSAAPSETAPAAGADRLSGLAFRARDPDAARARLAAHGFDVSEVRAGRKPGTRVFTVRAGLAAAPLLVLSASGPGA